MNHGVVDGGVVSIPSELLDYLESECVVETESQQAQQRESGKKKHTRGGPDRNSRKIEGGWAYLDHFFSVD